MGEAAQQCRLKTDWLVSLRKTTLVVTKQAVANVGGGQSNLLLVSCSATW